MVITKKLPRPLYALPDIGQAAHKATGGANPPALTQKLKSSEAWAD